jgi:hypothetical protein
MYERSGPVAQLLEHAIIIQERVFAHVFGVLTPAYFNDALFAERSAELRSFAAQFLPDRRTDREKPTYIPRARVTRQRLAGNALYCMFEAHEMPNVWMRPISVARVDGFCPFVNSRVALARSKLPPVALGAERSSSRASIESRSTISLDPTATASRRYGSRAEIHGDNCDSPRQM